MNHPTTSWFPSRRSLYAALLGASLVLAAPGEARVPGDTSVLGPRTTQPDLSKYATVYYVAPGDGAAKAADGSKAKPWSSVAAAVQAVGTAAQDHPVAILVAAGTYGDETINLRDFVDLYGGYAADTWQRDILRHETVLDGRDAHRVLIGADHARVDGFVIRGGRALGDGGAILCDGTSPTITNNRFEDNHTVAPTDIRPNRIHQDGHRGGAVAVLYEGVPVITNNLFRHNWTEIGDGGALSVYGWNRLPGHPRARIENNVFVDNRAGVKDYNRTRSSSGGAVVFSHEASPLFRNNVVAHNRSLGNSDAGGVYNEFYGSPTIENNWIVGNESDDDGGGIYTMRMGQPVIQHNLIAGNWTANGGVGGVRISKEGRANVIDNQIVHNLSGGGLYLVDGYLVARDNLIAHNQKGFGVRIQQHFDYFRPAVIEHNRIFGNEQGTIDVATNVGPAPLTTGNRLEPGKPATNESAWPISGARFDAKSGQTALAVSGSTGSAGNLTGRVVWRGSHWSVVASARDNEVIVWGDMSGADADSQLHLLPDYSNE